MASDPQRGQRSTNGTPHAQNGHHRERNSNGGSGPAEPPDEDRKPTPDEVRSAFTPPLGVPQPPLPEDESSTTSEFALPEGLRPEVPAEQEGSAFAPPGGAPTGGFPAFTPPHGIPVLSLTKEAPWQDRMRTMLRMPIHERPTPERTERPDDETGPAVPRVLDLTLRIGEILLAGGEGAEDVEAAMFGVAHAYGLERVEPTVTFTLLSISYQPSLVDDPVTASRTVRRRGVDYTRLSAVFRLVDDITSEGITLEEAYRGLAEIRRNRHPFPTWALTLASGLLSGGASILVGGGLLVFVAAAIGSMLGDRLAWLASGRGLPEFYQFVVAAMPPAAIGVAFGLAHANVQASAVITGGLFALIPGRALVAGVQDGLTGYYITAAARLLEVVYLIVGIVVGVLGILYIGLQLDPGLKRLNPEQALHVYNEPLVQTGASMLLVLAFCVLLQQERHTVAFATLNGGVAWVVYGALANVAGLNAVPSTAISAGLVGLFGQLLSRYRYASALPYVTAAIGPLLPGSATYFGLLNFAQGNLLDGIASLIKAASLALAIAVGVNLGSEVARLFLRAPGPEMPGAGRRAAKRTRGF
ncbi:threonine/serine exporter family protein [Streptomyces sp. NBC_01525]|uniref:Threonine/serine exporter family protein n=1 Tax=Streptomyces benahoarensis TaxID=2595054 RepID=A0A553ZMY2_9ACTN|nr:threonine/serine exporter family protein [Streptomyces benahoarensis]TSB29796.1 threonine/serine exporter family protein [Streptomyces benahoarensis]TSB42831.1 threonine/serine exporter family protein [Streptomyces benahoarensis]